MFRVDEVELNHELTAVADAERQGVLACIELVKGFFGLGVVEEGTCPSFGRTEHVRVGETTAEDNHVDVFKCFAPADKVGHHHIFYVEASQIERVSHFALTVGAFFPNDGSLYASSFAAVSADAILCERTFKVVVKLHFERLMLIVGKTFTGHSVHTLLLVQKVRCLVPCVAQTVDVESVFFFAVLYNNGAGFGGRITNLSKGDTPFFKELGKFCFVFIAHFNNHTRVLGKESFYKVFAVQIVQIDV